MKFYRCCVLAMKAGFGESQILERFFRMYHNHRLCENSSDIQEPDRKYLKNHGFIICVIRFEAILLGSV